MCHVIMCRLKSPRSKPAGVNSPSSGVWTCQLFCLLCCGQTGKTGSNPIKKELVVYWIWTPDDQLLLLRKHISNIKTIILKKLLFSFQVGSAALCELANCGRQLEHGCKRGRKTKSALCSLLNRNYLHRVLTCFFLVCFLCVRPVVGQVPQLDLWAIHISHITHSSTELPCDGPSW